MIRLVWKRPVLVSIVTVGNLVYCLMGTTELENIITETGFAPY